MLMDQARKQRGADEEQGEAAGGELKKPDWRQFTPPELHDDVERVIAAGVKLMYSPQMRDELKQAAGADMPIEQKLADNTVGLLLTLDQQSQGSLPVAALFPAAMGLLGEAADVLQAAGQKVSQEEWNEAALRMYVVIGKKLGGSDEQIMQGAQQFTGEGQPGAAPIEGSAGAAQPMPPAESPGAAGAAGEPPPDDEEAAMARGMQ